MRSNPRYDARLLVARDAHLLAALDEAVPPLPGEVRAARSRVIAELEILCQQWSQEVCAGRGFRLAHCEAAALHMSGSERIGLSETGQDIDVVLVVPRHVTRDDFFASFRRRLEEHPQVSGLRALENAFQPIITFDVTCPVGHHTANIDGHHTVNIDLLMATLNVERIARDLDIYAADGLELASDDTSKIALNGPRATVELMRATANEPSFLSLLRTIRLWARRRGVYSNKMGYLGGVNWSILAAKTVQMYPGAPLSLLVERCFHLFGHEWDWPTPVSLAAAARPPPDEKPAVMPILIPAFPFDNSSPVVTQGTLSVMKDEMTKAHRQVSSEPAHPRTQHRALVRSHRRRRIQTAGPPRKTRSACAYRREER